MGMKIEGSCSAITNVISLRLGIPPGGDMFPRRHTTKHDLTPDCYKMDVEGTRVETMEDYLIGETIGEGTFSKVKLGIHKESRRKVALKFVQLDIIEATIGMEQFRREIEIHSQMNHPNIAKLYSVIDIPEQKKTCLVVEFVQGKDMLDTILDHPGGRLPEKLASSYFKQIVQAVQYLHENGITHRDLKLENICVEQDVCKLIDFGFANYYQPGFSMRTPCGSSIYAAPEVLMRTNYSGPKADVWSLGVMLYSMVCGKIPWEGNSVNEQLYSATRGEWSLIPSASVNVQNLLLGCLEVSAEGRMGILDVSEHSWVSAELVKRNFGGSFKKMMRKIVA
ncbi:Protein kinase domain containing protein [Planoprotostelium fungivorum]|uniref:non-specific serine/threonine protein kinase n=1 Tax=Planoprotostelium fungivorum TaxID=1890364 RepID=A0A2P6N0G7_9EUKA|nr:Protein kinase domain containing protein [Planoprotostelium fungivorum]